jgi:hypothetical protein
MIKDRLSPHQRGYPMITVLKGLDIKGRLTDHQVQSDLAMGVLTGFNWLKTRSHGGLS